MSQAATLLSTAIADGGDRLSPFDCSLCLAYSVAGGATGQTQINGAIAAHFDGLSTEDIWRCIAYAKSAGASYQTTLNSAIAADYDGLSNGDIRECLASELGLNDTTVLASAIAAGFGKLSARDALLAILYGVTSSTTVLKDAIAAGWDRPSVRDVKMCVLYFFSSVTPPPDPTINILATTLNQFEIVDDATDVFLFPNLTSTSAGLTLTNVNSQITLVFSAFNSTTVGGIDIAQCSNLTSVSLPALTLISGGNLTLASNPALTTILLNPNVVFANDSGIYTFTQNALNATTVNNILRRLVLSGVTTLVFDLNGGTNAAPTGQGITDVATLIAAGNSITTN